MYPLNNFVYPLNCFLLLSTPTVKFMSVSSVRLFKRESLFYKPDVLKTFPSCRILLRYSTFTLIHPQVRL